MVLLGDRGAHGGRARSWRSPGADAASMTIGCPSGGAVDSAGFPILPGAVRGQLAVGFTQDGRGEDLSTGEVAELELGVVVAVAHDVGVVGVASPGSADVGAMPRGARGDDDVTSLDGAALRAGDGGRVAEPTSSLTYRAGRVAVAAR